MLEGVPLSFFIQLYSMNYSRFPVNFQSFGKAHEKYFFVMYFLILFLFVFCIGGKILHKR